MNLPVAPTFNCERDTFNDRLELSVILVNWNAVPYLRDCIASIYANTLGIAFEILVVDNGSTEEGVESLHAAFPDIRILQMGRNIGFAGANNAGFRASRGSFVLLLNPDTKLVGPAINTLMEAIRARPDAGIVGARHVDPALGVQTTSIQRFPSLIRDLLSIEALQRRWPRCTLWSIGPLFGAATEPVVVEVIPGACMLIRRTVFEQVGMFNEEYFMYAEDLDLNYKVAKAGYVNYYVPDAVIIHYGGACSSQQKVNQWATRMQLRAMNRYYTVTRSPRYAQLYRTAMGASAALRLLLTAIAGVFGDMFCGRHARTRIRQKWMAVLQWSLGRDGVSIEGGGTPK